MNRQCWLLSHRTTQQIPETQALPARRGNRQDNSHEVPLQQKREQFPFSARQAHLLNASLPWLTTTSGGGEEEDGVRKTAWYFPTRRNTRYIHCSPSYITSLPPSRSTSNSSQLAPLISAHSTLAVTQSRHLQLQTAMAAHSNAPNCVQ